MFRSGFSAIGKLAALVLICSAFLVGMAGVVYMSLKGEEISVPEITGKEFSSSERELASLGLKIHKKATRFAPEPPNTIIEQLPKPGETVKTGQRIIVVVSNGPGEGDEQKPSIKILEEDDAEKIEDMISDKPKKPKPSANRKKADTARDVNVDPSAGASGSNTAPTGNKKEPEKQSEPSDKTPPPAKTPNPATKPAATPNARPTPQG